MGGRTLDFLEDGTVREWLSPELEPALLDKNREFVEFQAGWRELTPEDITRGYEVLTSESLLTVQEAKRLHPHRKSIVGLWIKALLQRDT